MRFAALLVALFTIVVGIVGLISPDSGTEVRRLYFATPARLYRPALFALHGARGDPVCRGLSCAQDSGRVGSRDVHARTLGDTHRA